MTLKDADWPCSRAASWGCATIVGPWRASRVSSASLLNALPAPLVTVQVYVPTGDIARARSFYTTLFGREPEFAPHDDFLEWSPIAGQECWLQVSAKEDAAPMLNRVRFRVLDV